MEISQGCCVRAGGADGVRLVAAPSGCAPPRVWDLGEPRPASETSPTPDVLISEVSPGPPFWCVGPRPAEARCWGPEGGRCWGAPGVSAREGWDRGLLGAGPAGGPRHWPESSEVRWRWRAAVGAQGAERPGACWRVQGQVAKPGGGRFRSRS